jgi:hypothetical protein
MLLGFFISLTNDNLYGGSMATSIFQEMIDRWQSPIVARTEIEVFTGGLMTEKYQANLDSAGKGPAGRIRCGRKIGYPTREYAEWLEARSTVIPGRVK